MVVTAGLLNLHARPKHLILSYILLYTSVLEHYDAYILLPDEPHCQPSAFASTEHLDICIDLQHDQGPVRESMASAAGPNDTTDIRKHVIAPSMGSHACFELHPGSAPTALVDASMMVCGAVTELLFDDVKLQLPILITYERLALS